MAWGGARGLRPQCRPRPTAARPPTTHMAAGVRVLATTSRTPRSLAPASRGPDDGVPPHSLQTAAPGVEGELAAASAHLRHTRPLQQAVRTAACFWQSYLQAQQGHRNCSGSRMPRGVVAGTGVAPLAEEASALAVACRQLLVAVPIRREVDWVVWGLAGLLETCGCEGHWLGRYGPDRERPHSPPH